MIKQDWEAFALVVCAVLATAILAVTLAAIGDAIDWESFLR